MTQQDLVFEYYKQRPDHCVSHKDAVDWSVSEYKERTGKILRDPDRAIRKLYQMGFLIKVGKGVYKYDPKAVGKKSMADFTPTQKQKILARDQYKCVVCGRGKEYGVELQVDHIKPQENGGQATIENGQVLCGEHHHRKKTYSQTESGKRMFIRLYEIARKSKDENTKRFCTDVLGTYEKHNINGHIDWE